MFSLHKGVKRYLRPNGSLGVKGYDLCPKGQTHWLFFMCIKLFMIFRQSGSYLLTASALWHLQ